MDECTVKRAKIVPLAISIVESIDRKMREALDGSKKEVGTDRERGEGKKKQERPGGGEKEIQKAAERKKRSRVRV